MKKAICIFMAAVSLTFAWTDSTKINIKDAAQKKAAKSSQSKKKAPAKEKPVIVFNEDYEKAEEFFGLNNPKEAIPLYEKCLEIENINPEIYIHLGVAYYQTGDFTRSLACCVKGLSKPDTDHKILAYNAGNSAYGLTNYARAEACYNLAIKEDENFSPAYLNRANAQLKQDHIVDAKNNYIKYLELEPEDPQKEEIERLIELLSREIERRAKEKPELINPDDMNVHSESVIAFIDEEELVDYEIPEEKVEFDETFEELVVFEIAKAPHLPPEEKKEEEPSEVVEFALAPEKKEEIAAADEAEPFHEAIENEKHEEVAAAVENDTEEEAEPFVDLMINSKSEAVAEGFAESLEEEKAEPVDDLIIPEKKEMLAIQPEKEEIEGEKLGTDILPAAVYSLPAGTITIEPMTDGFSPNSPDSKYRKEYFKVKASDSQQINKYSFETMDEYGNTVRTMNGKKLAERLEWDGKNDSGELCDGTFTSKLTVNYKTGGQVSAETRPYICAVSKPQVTIIPDLDNFSPDGDGKDDVVKFKVSAESQSDIDGWKFNVKNGNKTVYSSEGKGKPEDFEWNGKTSSGDFVKNGDSLSFSMTITDSYGNSGSDEGKVGVTKSAPDPVVAKKVELSASDDGTLKINIPTLSFKINSSELVSTSKNDETIKKVYEILVDEQYEEYNVTITGYVNPDGEEWTKEEIELAHNRAKSVQEKLRQLGVDPKRMTSTAGTGKTKNKEFNRRVEFKLAK